MLGCHSFIVIVIIIVVVVYFVVVVVVVVLLLLLLIIIIINPLSYLSFPSVLHDWCNKDRGICCPVYGMMHIKEPSLLIGKSSPCGSSGFPLWLSEWSFTICLTPYNRKCNVLSASLNKTFPSFLIIIIIIIIIVIIIIIIVVVVVVAVVYFVIIIVVVVVVYFVIIIVVV